jgi:hypothetical protein
MVPEWIILLVAVAAFLCGAFVQVIASIKSKAKGEGSMRRLSKSASLGCLAMLGVWAASYIVGWSVLSFFH